MWNWGRFEIEGGWLAKWDRKIGVCLGGWDACERTWGLTLYLVWWGLAIGVNLEEY